MGSSVSMKTRTNEPRVFCRKHPHNAVTHFLIDSDRLICLTCFNNIPTSSKSHERTKCEEINSYAESVVFKQSENILIQALRDVKDNVEKRKEKTKALMSDVIQKRTKLQKEVKGFVENVISLLKFLETDLTKRINFSSQKVLDNISKNLNSSKTDLESIKKLENILDRKQDSTVHLQNMVDARKFIKQFMERKETKLPNPSFVLKLNKWLTLKQIIGSEKGKSNISLGQLKVENIIVIDDTSLAILSDITDDDTLEDKKSLAKGKNKFSEFNARCNTVQQRHHNEKETVAKTQYVFQQSHDDTSQLSQRTPKSHFGIVKMASSSNETQNDEYGQNRRSASSVAVQESGMTPSRARSRFSSRTPRESKLSITTPSGIDIANRRIFEEDEYFIQAYFVKWSEFELPSSTLRRNITDSLELDNGDILLCDQRNRELLLLSDSFILKDTFRFHSNPHNITAVERKKLLVTLPEENFIMRVDIENNTLIETDFKIHVSTKCRGIEHVGSQIFYTCKNSIFITEGADSYKIERAFKQPVSLTTERGRPVLYVCCRGNKSRDERGEVVMLNTKSLKVVSTLFHEHLKDPVSCTVDNNGNLFVCDVQPPSSIHVARDGKYSHVVLGSVNEKYQHIQYIRKMDLFMITENDSNVISFYKLRNMATETENNVIS